MRPEGKSQNFVFFDLSKLEASSTAAFLADQAQRGGGDAFPASRCHWIVSPLKIVDLLAASGEGPAFLKNRLAGGDRLFCTNPTGFDWNHLFPSEAAQEAKNLAALVSHEASLFLENTPRAPEWLSGQDGLVFRASPEGLCVVVGNKSVCLPWATRDKKSLGGVWWVVPGQALLTGLPPLPWADLLDSLPALLDKPKGGAPAVAFQAPTPRAKRPLSEIGLLRRSTSLSSLHQSILFQSQEYPGLGTKEAVDFEEALGGIRKRSLVANMQGQTDLREAGFHAKFQGGRLIRIEDATGTTLCSGTDSYIEGGGVRHPFLVNSAFSFEGDYSWGLRQSLMLTHEDLSEPGRAILDYYFVEESREFFVAATVRWPRWKAPVTVNRWAVVEMTLFDVPRVDNLTTRVVWPDGRTADRIHRGPGSGVFEGTDFVFSAGKRSLVLGFPQNQTPRPHLLPWKLTHGWSKSKLVVNPEGGNTPGPSTEFEGIEEHFSFYLAPAEGAKLPFSVTRKQAVELIPPYVIESDSSLSKEI